MNGSVVYLESVQSESASLGRHLWYVISFALLRIPSWIFATTNAIKLTIPFTTLLVIAVGTVYFTSYIVKIRILSQYKNLTSELPSAKSTSGYNSIKENKSNYTKRQLSEESDDGRFLSSYLEKFLSAIKIFGYLEKPVFHDLTKNMKTQKLNEGEILLLEDSIGLAIVVEGSLQIYHSVDDNPSSPSKQDLSSAINNPDSPANNLEEDDYSDAESDFEDSNTYIRLKNGLGRFQLLNTVKPGNPVSSLVNILKLFTSSRRISSNRSYPLQNPQFNILQRKTSLSSFDLEPNGGPILYSVPNVVARAATNCTIAIIPPQSFVKLIDKYPRSASHIIQMVLTRLHRVTFQTAHNYFGLTSEIMEIELLLNRNVNFELPYYLKEAAILAYKKGNTDPKSGAESFKDTNTIPVITKINLSGASIKSEKNSLRNGNGMTNSKMRNIPGSSRNVVVQSRDKYNPGDLLSSVPLSRRESSLSSSTPSQRSSFVKSSSQLPSTSALSNQESIVLTLESSILNTSLRTIIPKIPDDDIKIRSFSSSREETEESALRMALIEAVFNFLGINKESLSIQNSAGKPLSGNGITLNKTETSSSDISLTTSFTTSSKPPSMIRILPSDYAITSHRQKRKKKEVYKEELPNPIDFNLVKNEFAVGVEVLFYKKGSLVVEQNSNGKGLFYVISGQIDVTCTNNPNMEFVPSKSSSNSSRKSNKNSEQFLFTVETGGVAGYLASLVGYKSFVNLRAKTDVYVGFLPNDILERLSDKYFLIYLRMAEVLTSLISPRMLKLDHALEWIHLSASETLFNQNDPAKGIYVILNGRLRQLRRSKDLFHSHNQNDKDENTLIPISELAQGKSFGEVEVLTAMNRMSTIVAVRDSELVRIPRSLFGILSLEQPSIMFRISRLVARKILDANLSLDIPTKITRDNGYKYDYNLTIPSTNATLHTHNSHSIQNSTSKKTNYRTITVLPVTEGLPVESFAMRLVQAFKQVGCNTIGVNQRNALSHLGRHAFDRLAKLKQSGYFAELEEMYQTVVYIADSPVNSSWTNTCISQGDCILLLADATDEPLIGEYEKLLNKSGTTARTELILLHPERYVEPGSTSKWLVDRDWIHSHHHIQLVVNPLDSVTGIKSTNINNGPLGLVDKLIQTEFSKKTQENISKFVPDLIKSRVESFSQKLRKRKRHYYTSVHSYKSDFLRLARILSGQAIGVVLGGGGARGLSHLGVLQAIEEQGIPIDLIGGTSMGAFVGGLYAKDYDVVPIYGRLKSFSGRLSSIWRMIGDLTWPVTSYTTGHEFNRGIWKAFGDTRIEDFWIQYYCNSTNITESIQEIHSFGYAWRYIRASMSLAGLLPPLEENGSMLLDGGYVDNLPVHEMKARGCNTVFAVDVGSVDDRTPVNYGDSLNGFWILFNRWNPFSRHPNIPTMAEIQARLAYVSSVNALEKTKHIPGVIYTRPPIENFATLDFGKFEEIYKTGINYGRDFLNELLDEDKMPFIPGSKANLADSKIPEFLSRRRNSI